MSSSYRVIRAPLVFLDIWKHLAQNPSLARQVEVVEIQRQMTGFNFECLRPSMLPPEVHSAAQAFVRTDSSIYHTFAKQFVPHVCQAEQTLIAAVKKMTELKSFQWDREPPLLDSCLDDGVEDDIWTALRFCPNLRTLDVMDASDNKIPGSDTKFRPIQESQVCQPNTIFSWG